MKRYVLLVTLVTLLAVPLISADTVAQAPAPTPAPAWNTPQPAPDVAPAPELKRMEWKGIFADRRERRNAGITFFSVRAALAELQASGAVTEDMSSEVVSLTVMQHLRAQNPKAFEDVDWDAFFEWIMKIIEMIMSFFADNSTINTPSIAAVLPGPSGGAVVPFVWTAA